MLNEELATFWLLEETSAVRNDATQQTEAMDLQLDRLEDLLLFWEHKLDLDEREDEMLMLKQHGSPWQRRNADHQFASKFAPERRELARAYERLATERDATMLADKFVIELAHAKRVADCGQQKAAERAVSVKTGAIPIPAPRYSLLMYRTAGRQAEGKITERLAADWESAGRMEETLTAVPMAVERVAIDDTSSDQDIDGRGVDHNGDERESAPRECFASMLQRKDDWPWKCRKYELQTSERESWWVLQK
jgi:hypothetical protein